MTSTGDGRFQKLYQDGKPVATEDFVTTQVATGTTEARVIALLDAPTLTVENANKLGGFAAAEYQKKADEPKIHTVTFCLDVESSAPSLNVSYVQIDEYRGIISYKLPSGGNSFLRARGAPLPANECFGWYLPGTSITVLLKGKTNSGIYTCSQNTGGDGVDLIRLDPQPVYGDIVYVNPHVDPPTDSWHPYWGSRFVVSSDSRYVLQSRDIGFNSCILTVDGKKIPVEPVCVLQALTIPSPNDKLTDWLLKESSLVSSDVATFGDTKLGIRKPILSEFESLVVYYTYDASTATTYAFFPYYDTNPQVGLKPSVVCLATSGDQKITAESNTDNWLFIIDPFPVSIHPTNSISRRGGFFLRLLLFHITTPATAEIHTAVNLNADNAEAFVVLGDHASAIPHRGSEQNFERLVQTRTHIEGYKEPSASRFTGALTVSGGLGVTGDIHADNMYADSDVSLKCDIDSLSPQEAMEAIMDLQPRKYRWKNGRKKTMDYGFLAQEAQQCVAGDVKVDPHTGLHSMNTNKIIPFLVGAMQHIHNRQTVGSKRKRGKRSKLS